METKKVYFLINTSSPVCPVPENFYFLEVVPSPNAKSKSAYVEAQPGPLAAFVGSGLDI